MNDLVMKNTMDLKDGDWFSIDAGQTWFRCAVPSLRSVLVYADDHNCGPDAETVRIYVPRGTSVVVPDDEMRAAFRSTIYAAYTDPQFNVEKGLARLREWMRKSGYLS